MNSEPMCVPCVVKQCERLILTLHSNKNSQETEHIISQIRHQVLDLTAQLTLDDPPSKFTSQVLTKVYELLATDDPYDTIKRKQNEIGRKIYNLVLPKVLKSVDPIHLAIKYAASGNIIDVGPADPAPTMVYGQWSIVHSINGCGASHDPKIPLLDEINKLAEMPLAIDDYKIFKEKFRSAEKILYILDNAGEIYLDKLLIERLKGPEITMVVKSSPILNDAMKNDAIAAGLDTLGKIICVNKDKNCRYLGVDFTCVSDEFSEIFETADIVIAKGHANFESLVDSERDCFFILMAKCPVVAQKLGVKQKDRVFYYSPIKGD